jgi:hypothetical protein
MRMIDAAVSIPPDLKNTDNLSFQSFREWM